VNAKKERIGDEGAIALLDGIKTLWVMRGQKVQSFDLVKERPDDEALIKVMLGPTGNLRAPTIRKGKTLLVGFHGDTFADLLT
jgi:arsenate reductase-like glutaredoxin family protein